MTRRAWKLALPRAKCPSCGALLRMTGLFSRWRLEQVSPPHPTPRRASERTRGALAGLVAAGTDPAEEPECD